MNRPPRSATSSPRSPVYVRPHGLSSLVRDALCALTALRVRAEKLGVNRMLCAAMSCAGCQESVALGTECPPVGNGCVVEHESGEVSIVRQPTPSDGGVAPTSSGAGANGSAQGALPSADAGVQVATRFYALTVQNPSFERDGGVGGDVVLNNLVASIVSGVPVADIVFAKLPNWYACFPLSVSSLSFLYTDTWAATASAFGDYLSFVVNGTSVRQKLASPLTPKATYSFEVDVISESGGSQNLFLEARGATAQCGAGFVLGRSPLVMDSSDWTTTCVTFTADQAYSYLLLAPNYEGDAPSGNARLRVDGLRQVKSCP